MTVSAAERRFILDQLVALAQSDIRRLWLAAENMPDIDFATYVTNAFPQIVDQYHQLAAQTAATLFEEDFPEITTPARVAPPMPVEQLATSAGWALGADGREALDRMFGTAQRAIYDGDRDTTMDNAIRQKMRWVRVARADACAFCRLLASRVVSGSTYYSDSIDTYRETAADGIERETGDYTTVVGGRTLMSSVGKVDRRIRRGQLRGSRSYGSKYHDHCHCTAKVIPAGVEAMTYLDDTEPQFAAAAQQWDDEYRKARANAGSGDPKKILAAWRTIYGTH